MDVEKIWRLSLKSGTALIVFDSESVMVQFAFDLSMSHFLSLKANLENKYWLCEATAPYPCGETLVWRVFTYCSNKTRLDRLVSLLAHAEPILPIAPEAFTETEEFKIEINLQI